MRGKRCHLCVSVATALPFCFDYRGQHHHAILRRFALLHGLLVLRLPTRSQPYYGTYDMSGIVIYKVMLRLPRGSSGRLIPLSSPLLVAANRAPCDGIVHGYLTQQTRESHPVGLHQTQTPHTPDVHTIGDSLRKLGNALKTIDIRLATFFFFLRLPLHTMNEKIHAIVDRHGLS